MLFRSGQLVGVGDGVFDANDAAYSQVRVWRDLNQDGISQAAELKNLAELGIQNIKLGSTATAISYNNATLVQSGSFTRTDGTAGQAGSFNFAQNTFVRQFVPIAVSDAAKAMVDIKGSGMVRDLREAATLNPELIALYEQARSATTRAGYVNAVDALMREWGSESAYNHAGKRAMASGFGLILSEPQDAQERGWMDLAVKIGRASWRERV